MDSNKIKAQNNWGGMDSFWELLENKEEISNFWQTLYACADQLDALYREYAQLSLINMPNERTLTHVVFAIDATNNDEQTLTTTEERLAGTNISKINTVPLLKPEINGDAEYVEGVDYSIAVVDDVVTITWDSTPPIETGTYYAPSVTIDNDIIDVFGDMHWDMDLAGAGIAISDRKNIYHCLMLACRTMLSRADITKALNIIAGAEYTKYSGKAIVSNNEITVSYVNTLYAIRHAGNVYGSETETDETATIAGTTITGLSAAKVGDIVCLKNIDASIDKISDTYNTYELDISVPAGEYNLTVNSDPKIYTARIAGKNLRLPDKVLILGDTIHIASVSAMLLSEGIAQGSFMVDVIVPAAEYSATAYSVIPMLLNDCYAINGDLVYSCYLDRLPNSGPYSITQAHNYVYGTGYRAVDETFTTPADQTSITNGQYLGIYSPINPLVEVIDWTRAGETGIAEENYRYDDYITRNYLLDDGAWYYDGKEYACNDLVPGEAIIARVGYSLEYPATYIDANTISVSGTQVDILDMYGHEHTAVINFEELEEIEVDNDDGDRLNATILSGKYDAHEDIYTLTTLEDISSVVPTKIKQAFSCVHKHIVMTVDQETGEVITDRQLTYGSYGSACNVAYRRCKDTTYKTHLYRIRGVTDLGGGQYELEIEGDHPITAGNLTIPGSTTAIMWSETLNVTSVPVIEIEASNQTIRIEWAGEGTPPIGASLLYVGGLYNRMDLHVNTLNNTPAIEALIEALIGMLVPAYTNIIIHEI